LPFALSAVDNTGRGFFRWYLLFPLSGVDNTRRGFFRWCLLLPLSAVESTASALALGRSSDFLRHLHFSLFELM
jgi:hypothetical protein